MKLLEHSTRKNDLRKILIILHRRDTQRLGKL